MKPSKSECVITGTLSFIFFVSCIVGVAPLKFKSVSNGWKVKISMIADIYGKSLVAVFCILSLISVGLPLAMTAKPFYLHTVSDRVVTVFTLMLSLSVGLVGSFGARNRMSHVIQDLARVEKINEELNQYYKQDNPKDWKTLICVILLLILGIITIFTECSKILNQITISDDTFSQLQVLYIFYYVMIEYIQLISIQCFLVCSSVLYSFRLLNTCFKCLLTDIQDNRHNINLLNIHAKAINRLASQYSALCDVVECVNQSNGPLMLQLLVVFLMYLIITPYNLCTILVKQKTLNMRVLIQFVWFLFHFSNLVMVVEPCHQTIQEMAGTKILISKAMYQIYQISPSQHTLNTELELFYQHVMMHDVNYSPLKLFTVERGLILSIVSSITTYLVIVLSL